MAHITFASSSYTVTPFSWSVMFHMVLLILHVEHRELYQMVPAGSAGRCTCIYIDVCIYVYIYIYVSVCVCARVCMRALDWVIPLSVTVLIRGLSSGAIRTPITNIGSGYCERELIMR